MNISIIGASGFVGKNLINYLLENTDYKISAIAPHANDIVVLTNYKKRIKLVNANVLNYRQMKEALVKTDVCFYFVHMLDHKGDFHKEENEAAEMAGMLLREVKAKRIIYLGGLGADTDSLSKHLLSRHETGEILRKYVTPVIEFRASMVIGAGSASYEIVRDVVRRSPIILIPGAGATKTQPINVQDVMEYLCAAIKLPTKESIIVEIGSDEVLSYEDFIKKYKKFKGSKIPVIRVPFLPSVVAGYFLNFFTTRKRARIGQNMLKSFENEMVVTNTNALKFFPEIKTHPIEEIFLTTNKQ